MSKIKSGSNNREKIEKIEKIDKIDKKEEIDELIKLKTILAEKERKLLKIKETNKETDRGIDKESNSENDYLENAELFCKIGNKRTICLYGLHKKLPVSLHPEQWEKLYQYLMSGKLHKFIKENKSQLI